MESDYHISRSLDIPKLQEYGEVLFPAGTNDHAYVSIVSDDAISYSSVDDVSVPETNGRTDATFTIRLTAPVLFPVVFQYATTSDGGTVWIATTSPRPASSRLRPAS